MRYEKIKESPLLMLLDLMVHTLREDPSHINVIAGSKIECSLYCI